MKIRTMLLGVLLVAVGVELVMSSAAQATAGLCANCHVMHDSERGVSVSGADSGLDQLLRNDCLGCHTGDNSGGTPYVYDANAGNVPAGGNFFYSDSAVILAGQAVSKRKGHNPKELGANGTDLATPPGWTDGFVDIDNNAVDGGLGWGAGDLSCYGVYGCHGKHTAANSMTGTHHKNLNVTTDGQATGDAAKPENGYRFLEGIKGWEDTTYEYNVAAIPADGAHNIYFSEARASDAKSSKQTISYFCAECHGIFHSNDGVASDDTAGTANDGGAGFASPWIRHPVDIVMPGGVTEYAGYNTYRSDVPVGSSDVANNAMTVANAADRIVMCLSCHRAHASPYDAALRWDPSTDIAGGGTSTAGCFACHTTKDDGV